MITDTQLEKADAEAKQTLNQWGFEKVDNPQSGLKSDLVREVEVVKVTRYQVIAEIGGKIDEPITDSSPVYFYLPAPPMKSAVFFAETTVGEMKQRTHPAQDKWLAERISEFLEKLLKQGVQDLSGWKG